MKAAQNIRFRSAFIKLIPICVRRSGSTLSVQRNRIFLYLSVEARRACFVDDSRGGRVRFRRLFIGIKEDREPIILVVMLLLVILFAFTAVAFPIDDDPFENDELRVPAPWHTVSVVLPLISLLSLAALTCLFAAKQHSAEYLDSHIGEKRFSDDRTVSSIFTFFGSRVTVLFSAPSLFYSRRLFWDCQRRKPSFRTSPHPFAPRKPFLSGGTL